jgi:hypothetical protein
MNEFLPRHVIVTANRRSKKRHADNTTARSNHFNVPEKQLAQ